MGPTELVIVLALVGLLFGASKLPKLANAVGRSTKEAKAGYEESKPER